jgi:hypothetical protein
LAAGLEDARGSSAEVEIVGGLTAVDGCDLVSVPSAPHLLAVVFVVGKWAETLAQKSTLLWEQFRW